MQLEQGTRVSVEIASRIVDGTVARIDEQVGINGPEERVVIQTDGGEITVPDDWVQPA